MSIKFNSNFLWNYVQKVPFSLALERTLECHILSKKDFVHPILDIGCGDGIFSSVLFAERIEVGIDPNEKELLVANKLGIYDELIACEGADIQKPDMIFNTIFSNSTLEHIQKIQPVLDKAYLLLAPGGNFYVTVPLKEFNQLTFTYQLLKYISCKKFANLSLKFFDKFWKIHHAYNKDEWENLFLRSGFKIREVKQYSPRSFCLLKNFLIPLSFPAWVRKKISNKWIVSKGLRKILSYPLFFLIKNISIKYSSKKNQEYALIFFHLTK